MLRRSLIVLLLGAVAALLVTRVRERGESMPAFRDADNARARGVFHVHSEASHDSDMSLEEIAKTAAEMGLAFVVVTDHDVQLAAPITIDGVSIISSAELRTPFGHLVQLGAVDILPHAVRGELAIHAAVGALGGVPIIAHPTDPKRPWEGPVGGAGGVEIANLASSARRRGGPVLLGMLPAFAIWRLQPDLAMAQVYDRDAGALRRWDGETDPHFVGLCGVDAHGRIELRRNLAAWQLVLEDPLPDDVDARAAEIIARLSQGRFHCLAGIIADEPGFDFSARLVDGERAQAGDTVSLGRVEALGIIGPRSTGARPTVVLLRNGEEVVRTRGEELVYTHPAPGTYRVEVRVRLPGVLFGDRVLTVLYSNRIRVRGAQQWPQLGPTAVPRSR